MLASLCRWAGWFESCLVENHRTHFRVMWLKWQSKKISNDQELIIVNVSNIPKTLKNVSFELTDYLETYFWILN